MKRHLRCEDHAYDDVITHAVEWCNFTTKRAMGNNIKEVMRQVARLLNEDWAPAFISMQMRLC